MAKMNKVEELADRLHSTAIHLLRQVRVQDAATGIAPARLSALSVLVFGGAMSLNELARAEQVRPPTMSRIVDALQAEGLVRRTTNAKDRRAVVLEATEKGTAILWQGRKRRVKFLARHLSRLTEAELKQIENAVNAIQKAMSRE
ncbi:MAG TPA: MarR family transcriptional regulator [Candidatus Dormibacteraeota bacterium]|jgi:DNA-binding MarR family transcriptional regulator|nr:MarR family transcriptional regulator [Candidatus Dormibacteraeota bacterium]